MSLLSQLKSFPVGASLSSCGRTGEQSEKDFDSIINSLGHELYKPESDNGIDRVVITASGQRKTIQITAGSIHKNCKDSYVISKPLKRIRQDVDILAIGVDWRERVKVVLPQVGEVWVDIPNENQKGDYLWFLLPRSVFTHDNITAHYKMTSKCWSINPSRLKPPMEKALEAWNLLDIEDSEHIPTEFEL